jgi:glucose-6-phosphate 1-epimerase
MNLPPSVRSIELSPGYPVLEIDHPCCTGQVALHGAQVMAWQPAGQTEPVIYLSPDAVFREGKAIRGGIPICWPWFNAHPSDPQQPSHGFARSRFWELGTVTEDENGVTLCLAMLEGAWGAELVIRMGDRLGLALKSTNLGADEIKISGALHTYLQVGDIGSTQVIGLEDAAYLDTVGERTLRRQQGTLKIDREVDRIYESAGSLQVIDGSRTIIVEKEGSPSTVVWNPWIEKARALADLPDDDYRHFVCIETAIANEKAVVLKPGESAMLKTRLTVA